MTGAALTVNDLDASLDGEPRVMDLALAERLGMKLLRKMRGLIRAHRAELESHGPLFSARTMVGIGSGAQREVTVFWLNEPQAVTICLLSRTPTATAIRVQVVKAFLAWRHQETVVPRSSASPESDPWEEMRRRLDVVERAVMGERLSQDRDYAAAVTHLPIWGNGNRPWFWGDRAVRAFIIQAHRQMTIDTCLAACREEFGDKRTPTRSSVGRFWRRLDQASNGSRKAPR